MKCLHVCRNKQKSSSSTVAAEPNPEFETLMKAVNVARENDVNFILAVGGGSVIDGAKFVAAAVNFAGDPWDILVKGAAFKNPLPIGAVLTLPATGSESILKQFSLFLPYLILSSPIHYHHVKYRTAWLMLLFT